MLKLEQELSEAKALQLKLTAKTSFLVSDIRKVQYFLSKHIQITDMEFVTNGTSDTCVKYFWAWEFFSRVCAKNYLICEFC